MRSHLIRRRCRVPRGKLFRLWPRPGCPVCIGEAIFVLEHGDEGFEECGYEADDTDGDVYLGCDGGVCAEENWVVGDDLFVHVV